MIQTAELRIVGNDVSGTKTVNNFSNRIQLAEKQIGGFGKGITGTLGSISGMFGNVQYMAVAAGLGVVAGLGHMIKGSIDTAESLDKMSQRVGVSVENLSTLRHATELSGSSIEAFETSIGRLSRNILDFAEGKGEAKDAFDLIGITATTATGELKKADVVMLEIAEKFKNMEDGSEKTALAMKIFGRSGAELIPMLNQGAAGISNMQSEARALGLEISTNTAKEAALLKDNLTRVEASFNGAANELMSGLMPVLTGFSQFLVDDVNPAIKTAAESVDTWITGFSNLTTATGKYVKSPEAQSLLNIAKVIGSFGLIGNPFEGEVVGDLNKYDEALKKFRELKGVTTAIWIMTPELRKEYAAFYDELNKPLGPPAPSPEQWALINNIYKPFQQAQDEDAELNAGIMDTGKILDSIFNPEKELARLKAAEKLKGEWEKTAETLKNEILLAGLDPFDARLLDINIKAEKLRQTFAGIPGSDVLIDQNKKAQQAAVIGGMTDQSMTDAYSDVESENTVALAKYDAEVEAAREASLEKQQFLIDEAALQEELSLQRLSLVGDMFGGMSDLAGAFYDATGKQSVALFAVQKAFAVGQAVMNTYEGATKALAQGGIFGGAMAAIVIASGLANVAKILSTQPGSTGSGGGSTSFSTPNLSSFTTNNNQQSSRTITNTITIVVNGSANGNVDKYVRNELAPAINKAIIDDVIKFKNVG